MTHLLQDTFLGVGDMRTLYDRLAILPTSEEADIILIRSHVAYWSGRATAESATIRASRGHSYRVVTRHDDRSVRIADHYDHREGVTGWNSDEPFRLEPPKRERRRERFESIPTKQLPLFIGSNDEEGQQYLFGNVPSRDGLTDISRQK